jgi:hypothetical protein
VINPDFESWSHDNLVQFAKDSYNQMIDDMTELRALQLDLKAAIKAYRHINTRKHHDKEENEVEGKVF